MLRERSRVWRVRQARTTCGRNDATVTTPATYPSSFTMPAGQTAAVDAGVRISPAPSRIVSQSVRTLSHSWISRPCALEERADLRAVVADDLLEHRHEHAQRVVAHAPCAARSARCTRLRDGDREPVAPVDVEHHVHVGAAVADVDHAVARHAELRRAARRRAPPCRSRRHARDRLDLAGLRRRSRSACARCAPRGTMPVERRLHHLLGRGRDDVEVEAVAVDARSRGSSASSAMLRLSRMRRPTSTRSLAPHAPELRIVAAADRRARRPAARG